MAGTQKKVFLGMVGFFAVSSLAFFGPPEFITGAKKDSIRQGHGLFDVDKPEAVQKNEASREIKRVNARAEELKVYYREEREKREGKREEK